MDLVGDAAPAAFTANSTPSTHGASPPPYTDSICSDYQHHLVRHQHLCLLCHVGPQSEAAIPLVYVSFHFSLCHTVASNLPSAVIKSRETNEGGMSLWLPNTAVLFTTFYLVFSILSIAYITLLVCALKHSARSSTPQFMMIVLWPPMFYAVSILKSTNGLHSRADIDVASSSHKSGAWLEHWPCRGLCLALSSNPG